LRLTGMPTFPSFRRLVWVLPAIALWTACRDTTAPESRSPAIDETTTPSKTSTLGTLGGTVYFSLWPSETVWSVDPNGGSPVLVTTGAVVRVAPGGQRLAVVRNLDQALVTMNVDGSNQHTLRLTGPAIIDITWSSDGKKVAAYTDGLSSPSLIYIYDDSTSAVTTVTAPSRPAPGGSIYWRAGKWAITRLDGQNLPNGGGFLGYGVPAVADAGSGEFVDLTAPTFVDVGSGIFSPVARKAKIDSAGAVFWSGQDWAANHFGIFTASGSFRLNTGLTPDFAFSPKQDAVAAVRQTPITGGSSYFLDIIDWSGPYVRTLFSSTLTAFTGNEIMSVDWSRPKDQKLIISSVIVTPDSIKAGDAFSIQVKLKNDGAVPLTGAAPSLGLAPASLANITATPSPATKDLAPGEEAAFTYTLSALGEGTDTAVVNASASNGPATLNAPASRKTFAIGAAGGLTIDLHADSTTVGINHDFTVTASITNHGSVAVASTSATLTSDPSTGVTISTPVPSTPLLLLSPNATGDIQWTVRASQSASLNLHVVASGHDDNIAATVRTASQDLAVNVVDRRLIVTSTADDSLSIEQVQDSVCDLDAATAGNQCTLRAALQLANSFGGTQSITFNIPGGGVPSIAPSSALPLLTASISLDASTQPGGWVELSGATAGDTSGIVVVGGTAMIRGFVIDNWRNSGILLKGGNNHVVAGNRIGTTPDGLHSGSNDLGIQILGTRAQIGGTAGTSASSCSGDCNLISGNFGGIVISGLGSGVISGNWIGTDLTGNAALSNHTGIGIVTGSATGLIKIGGSTTRPGTSPGNLISGNGHEGIAVLSAGNVQIQGNIIGLNKAGTSVVSENAGPDVFGGESGVYVQQVVGGINALIGGTASERNVISGFRLAGVHVVDHVDSVVVKGNRIGTTLDGMSAAPNSFGVWQEFHSSNVEGHIEVRDNLISGNKDVGVFHATVATGNWIGVNAAGTAALPNAAGLTFVSRIGGIRPSGSTSCTSPCNLISGNRFGGAKGDTVQGNFIGTDITGTAEIPNSEVGVRGDIIGGESHAMRGVCDLACNLIAGNSGPGVIVDGAALVQGNIIGESAPDMPRNHGAGVIVTAPFNLIGGDSTTGNIIAGNIGAAVLMQGIDASQLASAEVKGNSITRNQFGIVYSTNSRSMPPAPVLESAFPGGSYMLIKGHNPGLASEVRIDFYASRTCDVPPQGEKPFASYTIPLATGGDWTAEINDNLPEFAYGQITATSTRDTTTSVFSNCVENTYKTKTTASANAGDTRVEVASTNGYTIGSWVKVNDGGSNAEWKVITGFGSLIFSSPFAYAHAANETIEPAAPPPASGWMLTSGGDAVAFGGATSFSAAKGKSIVNAAATPNGRGMRMLTKTGAVYSAGDATLFGDASALLNKQEQAVSIFDSRDGAGYYIITSKGRVLNFGDAQSLATTASPTSASDVAAAAQTPSRNGYLTVTACGAITTAGDAQSPSSVPAAKCDVVGAAIPTSGTGAWVLHADGHVDATGGAASLGSLSGKFGALAGIIAQGNGYVIAESNGKMHAFGTTTPTVSGMKGQAAALIPLLR